MSAAKTVPHERTAQWFGAHVLVQRIPDIRNLAKKVNADATTQDERLATLAEIEKQARYMAKAARHERLGLKAELAATPSPTTEAIEP